jgi:hypothetical protein
MGRDGKAVVAISAMFGVCAVVASGSASGVFFACLFIAGAICLFRER